MGLRLKKAEPEIAKGAPTPNKLSGMLSDDLYLFVESVLMDAQQRLSHFRTAPPTDKQALLTWLSHDLSHAAMGVEEMRNRG